MWLKKEYTGANKTRVGVWWFYTVIARLELQFLEFPSLHSSRLGAQGNFAKDLNSRNEAVAIFSIFKRVSIRSELVTSLACGSTWTYNSSCCQITLGKQHGMQLLCDQLSFSYSEPSAKLYATPRWSTPAFWQVSCIIKIRGFKAMRG